MSPRRTVPSDVGAARLAVLISILVMASCAPPTPATTVDADGGSASDGGVTFRFDGVSTATSGGEAVGAILFATGKNTAEEPVTIEAEDQVAYVNGEPHEAFAIQKFSLSSDEDFSGNLIEGILGDESSIELLPGEEADINIIFDLEDDAEFFDVRVSGSSGGIRVNA